MTPLRPRVAVLGTGALGSLVAGLLARPRPDGGPLADVTVAGTWSEALAATATHGLRIDGALGTWTATVEATPLGELAGPFDLVVVAVKSWRTAAVAATAARVVADDGHVLTLQNGLGNRELLAAAAGAERVVVGTTAAGATSTGPGRARCGGVGPTVLGGVAAPALANLVALFTRAGLPATATGDVEATLWAKLTVNCAINPVTALAGVVNGEILRDPTLRRRASQAAREVDAVARARGIHLLGDPAERALDVARATARNRSSMLQDFDRGRRSEIDALSGAVVAEGVRLGVPTPTNAELAAAVRAAESNLGARTSRPHSNSAPRPTTSPLRGAA